MIYFLLGIIIGFIFSIVTIFLAMLLSKSGTFKNAIQELDKLKKGKGFIEEGETPLDKSIKELDQIAEKHGSAEIE